MMVKVNKPIETNSKSKSEYRRRFNRLNCVTDAVCSKKLPGHLRLFSSFIFVFTIMSCLFKYQRQNAVFSRPLLVLFRQKGRRTMNILRPKIRTTSSGSNGERTNISRRFDSERAMFKKPFSTSKWCRNRLRLV
jgi:hypothetical protein